MPSFSFVLPSDFADYEWEVTSKGWFSGAQLIASGMHYKLNFYDPNRLRQDIEGEHAEGRAFFEPNLVVVQAVTRANMEQAAVHLAQSGYLEKLTSE